MFYYSFALFVFSFEIQAQVDSIGLTTPNLIYPSSETNFDLYSSTPTFKWTESPAANGYEIYINEVNEKNENEVFFSTLYTIISGNQFRVFDSILVEGKKYSLKLRAYNSTNFSEFSRRVYFTVKKQKPALLTASNKILPPVIISKNNLQLNPGSGENQQYKLVWNGNPFKESYQLIIEGINTSVILGEKYDELVNITTSDTSYNLDPKTLLDYNNYRWKIRSKIENEWSEFTDYYYFTIQKENKNNIVPPGNFDDLILRFKYAGYIDEMLLAKYKEDDVYLPLLELLSFLKIQHSENSETKEISVVSLSNQQKENKINFLNKELLLADTTITLKDDVYIAGDVDYYVKLNLVEKLIEGKLDLNLRAMDLKFSSVNQLPMVDRLINQKKLVNINDNSIENHYPLAFDRERKNIAVGFFDYSLSGNYVKEESPFYSFNFGLGTEFFGGDAQIFSQHSLFQNKFVFNQTDYKWRYTFLNNKSISSVSLGNINNFGLQSYDFRGISISNEPLESRRFYGRKKIEEKINPFWKVEIFQNNSLIDIVQADDKGDLIFYIPFTYGTTLVELHQYGPNGEYKLERKMYQIPVEQLPTGEFEYSINFGKLIAIDEYLAQASSSYGINDWLTTQIGTDIFTKDFENSSIYSKTSARILDGYITNLTIAPNAYYEFGVNSIFSDLASFNLSSKIYESNSKFNPTKIKNEIDGNLFIPFSIDENIFSLLLRTRRTEFSNLKRYDFSVRTFYDFDNFSPSLEYDYSQLSSNKISSSILNFRLNYSFYFPSAIFGGNIIDSRLVYNLNKSIVESFNLTLATTIFQNYRVQLSHNINFNSSFSDTQLRVVFDLPFIRSNTNISKSVFSQSVLGSVNYNNIFNQFDFHNRGMVGKSAAALRFYLDENNNNKYEIGEQQIENMDISVNSIGNKTKLDNGSIVINDLESYTKYDVKLVDRKSKNPLWFPKLDKFSFISDPNQYKEISFPFYEAAVVNGTVIKLVENQKLPVEGINVYFKKSDSEEIIKIKTMSDGSFYQYGIEPGDYEIYVDETQLERIKLKSYPEKIVTKVYSINSENYNKDLEFILK